MAVLSSSHCRSHRMHNSHFNCQNQSRTQYQDYCKWIFWQASGKWGETTTWPPKEEIHTSQMTNQTVCLVTWQVQSMAVNVAKHVRIEFNQDQNNFSGSKFWMMNCEQNYSSSLKNVSELNFELVHVERRPGFGGKTLIKVRVCVCVCSLMSYMLGTPLPLGTQSLCPQLDFTVVEFSMFKNDFSLVFSTAPQKSIFPTFCVLFWKPVACVACVASVTWVKCQFSY